jgi:hypothetical protein
MLLLLRSTGPFLCLLAAVYLMVLTPLPAKRRLLPGNFWPNLTLESDTNGDGVPDFWHKGGSCTAMDL